MPGNAQAKRPSATHELLHAARCGDHVSRVEYLLQKNADVNAQDEDGWSSLHHATWSGHTAVVELLLKSGANPDLQDKRGWSSLHQATWSGHTAMVELLLKSGANRNIQTKSGKVPLQVALEWRNAEMVELLVSAGAQLKLIGQDAATVLIRKGETTKNIIEQAHGMGRTDLSIGEVKSTSERVEKITAKVVLIGQTCAGKTSLLRTLKHNSSQLTKEEDRTIGVELTVLDIDVHPKIICHVYDLGGQPEYYPLHQLLISPHCLFSLVVDLYNYCPEQFHIDVQHFYYTITHRVLTPVLQIICTKVDLCQDKDVERICKDMLKKIKDIERDEVQRLEIRLQELEKAKEKLQSQSKPAVTYKFCKLKEDEIDTKIQEVKEKINPLNRPKLPDRVMCVSSKSLDGIEEVREDIANKILQNENLFPSVKIPPTWLKLAENLRVESKDTGQSISKNDLSARCKKCNISDEDEVVKLLWYIRTTGQILHYESLSKLLSDRVFINPEKILSALSVIFSHKHKSDQYWEENKALKQLAPKTKQLHKANFMNQGITSETVLKSFLSDESESAGVKFEEMLQLLYQFDLCFRLVHCPQNLKLPKEENFLIPSLLRFLEGYAPSILPSFSEEHDYQLAVCFDMNTGLEPIGLYEKIATRINPHLRSRTDTYKCTEGEVGKEGVQFRMEMLKCKDRSCNPELWLRIKYGLGNHNAASNNMKLILSRILDLMSYYPSVIWDLFVYCPSCSLSEKRTQEWEHFSAENTIYADHDDAVTEMACDRCKVNLQIHNGFPDYEDYVEQLFEALKRKTAENIGGNWKMLLRHLIRSLEKADKVIGQIDNPRENPELRDKTFQSLHKWKEFEGKRASFERLVAALSKMQQNNILDSAKIDEETVKRCERRQDTSYGTSEQENFDRLIITVVETVSKNWKRLSRELFPSLRDADRVADEVTTKYPSDLRECCYTMLREWSQQGGRYETLIKSLHKLKCFETLKEAGIDISTVTQMAETGEADSKQAACKHVLLAVSDGIPESSWRFLYRKLSRDVDADIVTIEEADKTPNERAYQMLRKWTARCGSGATYSALIDGLTGIRHVELAEMVQRVCEEYGVNTQQPIKGIPVTTVTDEREAFPSTSAV